MSPSDEMSLPVLVRDLERTAYEGRTADGASAMIRLLNHLACHKGPFGVLPPELHGRRLSAYTRIASAITALTLRSGFTLTAAQIAEICSVKPVLEAIFEVSGFEGADHLLNYFSQPSGRDQTLTLDQVFLLALYFSLDRAPPELVAAATALPPDRLVLLMAGWFVSPCVHSAQGEQNRGLLIDAASRVQASVPPAGALRALASAWMFCSYADNPAKHQVKASLNTVWRHIALSEGIRERNIPLRATDKPKVLVCAERMMSGHAMHRSYAACLSQLRSRFSVECLVSDSYFSEDTRGLFDAVHILDARRSPVEIAGLIVRCAPDIILFPSLGMSDWTLVFANTRFAPVQIMLLGHPAPAMSPFIDYSVVQKGHGRFATEFGGKVIERRAWGHFVPHPMLPSADAMPRAKRTLGGSLTIAVNSSMMKLSPRFLALCMAVERQTQRALRWRFFSSETGVDYDRFERILKRSFRDVALEPRRAYLDYLGSLAECDLALAAFPFGNTNSSVDCCLLGLPVVAYVGNEVLSIGDNDVLSMAGIASQCLAVSDEAYLELALRFIRDDSLRLAISDQLLTTDLRSAFFRSPDDDDHEEFVKAIDWIYRNHSAIQACPAHLIEVGSLGISE